MDSPSPDPPATLSPAHVRFNGCRWQRAAEADQPACCGHRDVLPMAGTSGFNPDSWCGDCQYFKAKRTPKVRPPYDPSSRY